MRIVNKKLELPEMVLESKALRYKPFSVNSYQHDYTIITKRLKSIIITTSDNNKCVDYNKNRPK